MTARQLALYERVLVAGGLYLHGADVRVAKALAHLGLVDLEDNGVMLTDRQRSDRERWLARTVPLPIPFNTAVIDGVTKLAPVIGSAQGVSP